VKKKGVKGTKSPIVLDTYTWEYSESDYKQGNQIQNDGDRHGDPRQHSSANDYYRNIPRGSQKDESLKSEVEERKDYGA